MTRFVLAAVLLGSGALAAAPVPKAVQKKPARLPLEVGTRWEFALANQPEVVNETREITAVEVKDGATYATQVTSNLTQVYRADGNGIAVVRSGNRDYANPRFILKAAMKEGDEWEWDAGTYTEVRTVGRAEKVSVPAGEFEAVPLTYKTVQNGQSFGTTTVWYADGVGLVRIDHDGQPSQVLKSFTRGKK